MSASALFKLMLLSAVLSLYFASAQKVNVLPCKNVKQDSTINEVIITPCPKLPCIFKKGTNVSVAITFTMDAITSCGLQPICIAAASAAVASNVTTVVHGIIGGVAVPYPTAYTDACKTSGIHCPLKPNDKSVYKAKLYVKPEYPTVELYVKWELQYQPEKDILCFEVPAEVM